MVQTNCSHWRFLWALISEASWRDVDNVMDNESVPLCLKDEKYHVEWTNFSVASISS